MSGQRLGLLGGTFDPVHYGHLDAAEAARTHLGLHTVTFIPAHDPPHRHAMPRASAFHRFALTALAIADRPAFRLSDLELTKAEPSYTIDTLRALQRNGADASQLFFILGTDAFAEISTWKEYPAVLEAANFVVMTRPGTHVDVALARVPELARRLTRDGLPAAGTRETSIFLVEARTRDVSSTGLRQRLAAGQTIDGLVPDAVARHIAAHHLYGAVETLHG